MLLDHSDSHYLSYSIPISSIKKTSSNNTISPQKTPKNIVKRQQQTDTNPKHTKKHHTKNQQQIIKQQKDQNKHHQENPLKPKTIN